MLIASDSQPTTPSSPENPVDYSEEPYLYVSSSDLLISDPGSDYKDFTIAHGDDIYQDGQYQHYSPVAQAVRGQLIQYGQGDRGLYDADACSGPGASDDQDNYLRNVITFGQEYVVAQSDQKTAHYPVQSEADIMFVFSHGGTNESEGKSGFGPFRHNYDPNTAEWKELLIGPDWANRNNLLNRDADWLAVAGCDILADCCWQKWRDDLCSNGPLRAVVGFRGQKAREVEIGGEAFEAFDDEIFWGKFAEYLEIEFEGVDEHWVEELRPCSQIELGVRCYMEAAWWYADTVSDPEYPGDSPTKHLRHILEAAAVDKQHRYIIYRDEARAPFPIFININDTSG